MDGQVTQDQIDRAFAHLNAMEDYERSLRGQQPPRPAMYNATPPKPAAAPMPKKAAKKPLPQSVKPFIPSLIAAGVVLIGGTLTLLILPSTHDAMIELFKSLSLSYIGTASFNGLSFVRDALITGPFYQRVILILLGAGLCFFGGKAPYMGLVVPGIWAGAIFSKQWFNGVIGDWSVLAGGIIGAGLGFVCIYIADFLVFVIGCIAGCLVLCQIAPFNALWQLIASCIVTGVISVVLRHKALPALTGLLGGFLFLLGTGLSWIWLGIVISAAGIFVQYAFLSKNGNILKKNTLPQSSRAPDFY